MIFGKKKAKTFPKVMNLYYSSSLDQVIFAPCNFRGGVSSEIDGAATILSCENPSALGETFKAGLLKATSAVVDISKKEKLSDWPAFVAGNLRSGKEFERKYTRYYVKGANESNHFYTITSPTLPNGIELRLFVKAHEIPLQIGIEIKKLHEYYTKCLKNT